MSAGSITHFILGFVILYLMAVTMGLPNLAGRRPDRAGAGLDLLRPAGHDEDQADRQVTRRARRRPVRPAEAAGLQAGDKVLSVGGKPIADLGPTCSTAVQVTSGRDAVRGRARRPAACARPSTCRGCSARPHRRAPTTVGMIGALAACAVARPRSTARSPRVGATFSFTGTHVRRDGAAARQVPREASRRVVTRDLRRRARPEHAGQRRRREPDRRRGRRARLWVLFFFLLASLNFFIGVFNLLPLLPLDGGHIAVVCTSASATGSALAGQGGRRPGRLHEAVRDHDGPGARRRRGDALTVTADIVNPIRMPSSATTRGSVLREDRRIA